ncbi:MAG: hypothetical protein LBD50_00075 [Rickettsiales bacterium]|jgi:hypothetical protein|nr:hypothetical protein [Rickettsiales bacterium]
MKKILFFVFCSLLIMPLAHAVCPVCTVAVGAGLEGARLLGVDDVITGIWAGGFTLILVFWTARWLARRGVKNVLWYLLSFVFYYALLSGVYFLPDIKFGADTLWGIDKLMLGAIVGTVVLYAAEKWSADLIKANGGKSRFKFQKIIMPFGALLAASMIFAGIIYL